jgi:predicted nucleic acid-binding protein
MPKSFSIAEARHDLAALAAAEWHAAERARLAALGKTPPFVDGQITAIAYANSLTLVTLNSSIHLITKASLR